MNPPLHTFTGDVSISYHVFNIEDDNFDNVDEPPDAGWYAEDYVTVRQGIVYIVSDSHTHSPLLTMQDLGAGAMTYWLVVVLCGSQWSSIAWARGDP